MRPSLDYGTIHAVAWRDIIEGGWRGHRIDSRLPDRGCGGGLARGADRQGHGFGLVGNIVVGIVGAFIAGWLLPQVGLNIGGGFVAAIINALIGAVILLFLIGLFKRAT